VAWRFPNVMPVPGDVLHPNHWNSNIDAFSSEMNGFIDRDNLGSDVIDRVMVTNNTFAKVFTDFTSDSDAVYLKRPDDGFSVNTSTTSWHSTGINEEEPVLPKVTFTADTDGWVVCDFDGGYHWLNPYDPIGGCSPFFAYNDTDVVFARVESTSSEYTRMPGAATWGDVLGDLGVGKVPIERARDYWMDSWVDNWAPGAIAPTWSATGTVPYYVAVGGEVEGRYVAFGKTLTPSDRDSISFRMLVDGITVAETGWLSIGLFKNGFYLTGVAPVSAGVHEVTTQVRVAHVRQMEATAGALGDSGAAFKLTKVSAVSHGAERVPGADAEVLVRARNLNVVFRKR
jgi:hypothetical protein